MAGGPEHVQKLRHSAPTRHNGRLYCHCMARGFTGQFAVYRTVAATYMRHIIWAIRDNFMLFWYRTGIFFRAVYVLTTCTGLCLALLISYAVVFVRHSHSVVRILFLCHSPVMIAVIVVINHASTCSLSDCSRASRACHGPTVSVSARACRCIIAADLSLCG